MVLQPSDAQTTALRLIAGLQESARRGDWAAAGRFSTQLAGSPAPVDPEEIAEYLQRLQHALAITRASRSAAAATLSRIRAIAKFGSAANVRPKRQNFVVPANC
jgi:hypothetical protein